MLAATRMGSGEVAATNYRHHLCQLLDLDDAGMPAGFRDSLYLLWKALNWWLDERHGGQLGLSTVVEDQHWTHIGYPISQTLFRRADRRQLDDFFRWIGLEPGEAVDQDVLVAHFRAWAAGRDLSPGALRMVSEPQFGAVIGRILQAFAGTWDGTGSRATTGRRAPLRVVVTSHPRLALALLPLQPEGFPERLQGSWGGRTVTPRAEDGVYELIGAVEPRMLLRGLRLGAGDCQLVLEGADAHVLRLDPDLGGWVSVDAIEPGERHWLLASPEHKVDVLAQLKRSAQEPGDDRPGPGVLRHWTLVRNVVFDAAAALTGALAGRRPTNRHRLTLRGGLPLGPSGAYLAGGAPDLWLPVSPTEQEIPMPLLDGAALDPSSEQIRLADLIERSSSSRHVVSWAGAQRSFLTVASSRRAPSSDDVPAHALSLDGEGRVIAHQPATVGDAGDMRARRDGAWAVGAGNLEARIGSDQLYVVNSNGGQGFQLAPARHPKINGLFSVDLKHDRSQQGLDIPELAEDQSLTVSLGSRQVTDTLLLSAIDLEPGLRLDPRQVAGRAALYSAGFLLRESAARQLDVQGRELRVGLWIEPQQDDNDPRGWIFLADALENGAGYCTHLGQPAQLAQLLASARDYLTELEDDARHTCDSSCYDCLRAYENQAYHGLLDWRLARDWLDLAEGKPLQIERWASAEEQVARSFGAAFDAPPQQVRGDVWTCPAGDDRLIVVCHPLEDTREDWWSERLAEPVADAEDRSLVPEGGLAECRTSFDMLRRPGAVFAGL